MRIVRSGQNVLDNGRHHPESVLLFQEQQQRCCYGSHSLAVADVRVQPGDRLQNSPQSRHAYAVQRREASVGGQCAQQVLFDLLGCVILIVGVRLTQLTVSVLGSGLFLQCPAQSHPHELAQGVGDALAANHLFKLLAAIHLDHLVPGEGLSDVGVEREFEVCYPFELVLAVLDEEALV